MNASETMIKLIQMMEFQTVSISIPDDNEKLEKVFKQTCEAMVKSCESLGIKLVQKP